MNVNLFRVLKTTDKTVTVQEIEAEAVPGTDGFMCDNCVPKPGVFTTRSKPIGKVVHGAMRNNPKDDSGPDGIGCNGFE
jgi:hypothetical protein